METTVEEGGGPVRKDTSSVKKIKIKTRMRKLSGSRSQVPHVANHGEPHS